MFSGILLTSCGTYFKGVAPGGYQGLENNKYVDVMKIHTSTDGLVYFSTRHPGKMSDGEISGVKHVPLQFFTADSVVYRVRGLKEIPRFAYSDGKKFEVVKQDDLNLVYTSSIINVPVSEVSNIVLRRNGNKAFIFSGLIVGVSALSIYIISNMSLNVGDSF